MFTRNEFGWITMPTTNLIPGCFSAGVWPSPHALFPCPTGEEKESEEGGRLLSCWDLAQDARLAQDASKCAWKRTWGILMDQILPNIFPTIPKTKLSVVQQYRSIRTFSHSKLLANCAIIILVPTIHGHFEGEMIINPAMKVRMINTSGLIKWFDKTIDNWI